MWDFFRIRVAGTGRFAGAGLCWLRVCVALLAGAAAPAVMHAQVGPASSRPFTAYGYAMASGAEHEFNIGHALGGTGGIILERSPWLSLDGRAVILRARVPLHTYLGEIGPRVAPRFGPVRPYAEALVGEGHTGYVPPQGELVGAYGAAWSIDFGADLRVTHRLEWRVAEYSRSHIYAGTGASPTILSTGVVYRIF